MLRRFGDRLSPGREGFFPATEAVPGLRGGQSLPAAGTASRGSAGAPLFGGARSCPIQRLSQALVAPEARPGRPAASAGGCLTSTRRREGIVFKVYKAHFKGLCSQSMLAATVCRVGRLPVPAIRRSRGFAKSGLLTLNVPITSLTGASLSLPSPFREIALFD